MMPGLNYHVSIRQLRLDMTLEGKDVEAEMKTFNAVPETRSFLHVDSPATG
jgi:hypothetical protein